MFRQLIFENDNYREEKTIDGAEKAITYREYVEKINKRAMEERKKKKKEDKEKWSKLQGKKGHDDYD